MIKKTLKKLWKFILFNSPVFFRVKYFYFMVYGRWPQLNNPRTFNEKVLRRILFDRNSRYADLADKYKVREYIRSKLGDKYLIPLIHVTDEPDTLLSINDWSGVVIKPNHAAGMIRICDFDPSLNDKMNIIAETRKWLSVDFSKVSDEWHYSLIPPLVLMEKKITTRDEIPRDYKFHCFKKNGGVVNYVLQLVDGRFGLESRGYYLNSLDNLAWHHGSTNYLLDENEKKMLYSAIELNQKLMSSDEFNYVRIDWYIVNDKLYFGEMTFTPGSGRSNEFGSALEKIMSDWWVGDR